MKQLVAELTLDKTMLQDVLSKKMVKPLRRGPMVERLVGSYLVSERHACRVLRVPRATYHYRSCLDPRPEQFTSKAMNLWAYRNSAEIDFSRPGKPTDNAFVESFNGTLRSECLNTHWLLDLKEARHLIEAWLQEYNESRPHASLDDRTPSEFASQIAASRDLAGT